MTAVVHFGMPKTGTTSIQASLHALAAERAEELVYITGQGQNANRLVRALFRKRIAQPAAAAAAVEARRELASQLAAAAGRKVILSSEVLPGVRQGDLIELRKLLAARCGDVQAVGYIRKPKAFMESVLQQRIKSGASSLDIAELYPQYRQRYEKFAAAFGDEQTHYWLYEPEAFREQCVVRDFCGRLGLSIDAGQVRRVNEGLSLPALTLLCAYNRFSGVTYSPNRTNPSLVAALTELKGPKLRLHSSVVAPVLADHREDIAWMEGRLGARLHEALEAGDADAVRSADDLLAFRPEALQWLAARIGGVKGERVLGGDPAAVAAGMAERVRQLAARTPPRAAGAAAPGPGGRSPRAPTSGAPGPDGALVAQWVRRARARRPALAALPERECRLLASELLNQLRQAVTAQGPAPLVVPGLGTLSAVADEELQGSGQEFLLAPARAAAPAGEDGR